MQRMGFMAVAAMLAASSVAGQTGPQPNDPFPAPIAAVEGVVTVDFVEFASIPDVAGQPARMMILSDEPGSRRLIVNDMRGPLYAVSYDGKTVREYVDINAASWGVSVQSQGNVRGFQSFAFHPEFSRTVFPS